MSFTNETTYYGLPLPTGSDKSTFTDNNTAFQAVDAALHTAAEGAAQAAEDITGLTTRVGAAEDDIDALELDLGTEKGKIEALQNKETLQDAAIEDVRSDCEGMVSAYNEPTATSTHAYVAGDYFIYNDVLYQATDTIAIGDTIVPNTNCKTTTVADELDKVNNDLANKADSSSLINYQPRTVRVEVSIPNDTSGISYFIYPAGFNKYAYVVCVKCYDKTYNEFITNPTWAEVDLYENNGVISFSSIPAGCQGSNVYVALINVISN